MGFCTQREASQAPNRKSDLPSANLLLRREDGEDRLYVSYSQIEMFQQCPYKWYKSYVEGMRSFEKQEATSYGTVVHQMLEYFFKNHRRPTMKDLSDAYNYFAEHEDIPFTSVESGLEATRDAGLLIEWIGGMMKKDKGDLEPIEKLLRFGYPIGIEERFCFPYKLPMPVELNGKVHTHVWISGSIDLHMGLKKGGKVHHYVVDWKSGKKVFEPSKLKHNLQHPIYAFYIYRKYGDGLPDMGLYFFTRKLESQTVKVDEARRDDAIGIMNKCFLGMYDFVSAPVTKFYAFVEEEKEDGTKGYRFRTARLNEAVPENKKPCPSALCYYCDFGKHKKNLCPYSSDWDPSKKKENGKE